MYLTLLIMIESTREERAAKPRATKSLGLVEGPQ